MRRKVADRLVEYSDFCGSGRGAVRVVGFIREYAFQSGVRLSISHAPNTGWPCHRMLLLSIRCFRGTPRTPDVQKPRPVARLSGANGRLAALNGLGRAALGAEGIGREAAPVVAARRAATGSGEPLGAGVENPGSPRCDSEREGNEPVWD